MICEWIVALSLAAPAPDMAGAIEAVRDGRFVEALLAAETEPDAARRAEAALFVRHHAGDLDGALLVAANARRDGVATAWLEEREAFVALSMRDADRARVALQAIERRADHSGAQIAALAEAHGVELAALERVLDARDRSTTAAAVCVAAFAVVATAIAIAPRLTRGRALPSP